ncbi:unnamed protein product [Spirodela intermedia]|uniref:Uncharacterized protein n=1 Tax=Spirodela intermedia TaxID=51605 RepID=A0A7I8IU73_SPIIN|nr:unnamed protein product [Spirodela intermedia]CAA6661338.1 unnamed protein product [Spirodela intermedia]
MGGEGKHHYQEPYPGAPPPQAYGTFQGQGLPLTPGTSAGGDLLLPRRSPYYPHGYQTVQAVAEGHPVREPRLPCCGVGLGWFLFIIGFFLVAIPWYMGAFLLFCSMVDRREKPGYVACTIAAVLATVAIVVGATNGG